MAGIELIIFGLFLDAIGAIFIVKPFLRLFTVQRDKDTREVTSKTLRTADTRAVQTYAWYGLGFLIAGFFLQAVGVWVQSLEINSMMNGS